MNSKPVVAVVMPGHIQAQMFTPADMTRLRATATVVIPTTSNDPTATTAALSDATVAITGWGSPRFTDEMLAGAPRLRLIAHSAGTVKGLVNDAVYDRGIRVTTAAAANATPVAEFTVAMMVTMLKGVPWLTDGARGRQQYDRAQIRELRDITVGLVGASRVGREVIRLLASYPRLRIKLHDPYLSSDVAKQMNVELVSLDEACGCEVVSIHAPAIPETRHMLNARTLALMPDHAVFINTSRGSLVDEAALVAEVRRRSLFVCLDVTDPEPPAADSPLRNEPRILLTPHIAGSMKQARTDMGRLAIDETLLFLRSESLHHEVTRSMLALQA